MNSIGLNVANYRRADRLLINPLDNPAVDEDCETSVAPKDLMVSLVRQIKRLPSQHKIIIVDAITNLVSNSGDRFILGFFSACKNLCGEERTIIQVVHSQAVGEKVLKRVRDLCDAHFTLCVEQFPGRLGTTLEVRKAHNAELNEDNTVSFEVVSRLGIQPLSVAKVRTSDTRPSQDVASGKESLDDEDTGEDDDLLSL